MTTQVVKANGIDLWTESFGDPADPTVLLICGHGAQGILWPDELCELLAAGRRHVVRYDNRDTGESQYFDYSLEPYTISDMAADAIGILDAYGVAAGHLVGGSMGGGIAQTAAFEHPDRVATLTSWMSTPLAESLGAIWAGAPDPELPPPSVRWLEFTPQMASPAANDDERVERAVQMWRIMSGSLDPITDDEARERERRILARTKDPDAGNMNHSFAVGSSPDRTAMLATITCPTLVIHGSEDPGLPLPHGEAVANAIPGARLLVIDGMGHDFPRAALPRIVDAIIEHTAA